MAKIYVASSWRNVYYPEVVTKLRKLDTKSTISATHHTIKVHSIWKDIDPDFDKWNVEE